VVKVVSLAPHAAGIRLISGSARKGCSKRAAVFALEVAPREIHQRGA